MGGLAKEVKGWRAVARTNSRARFGKRSEGAILLSFHYPSQMQYDGKRGIWGGCRTNVRIGMG